VGFINELHGEQMVDAGIKADFVQNRHSCCSCSCIELSHCGRNIACSDHVLSQSNARLGNKRMHRCGNKTDDQIVLSNKSTHNVSITNISHDSGRTGFIFHKLGGPATVVARWERVVRRIIDMIKQERAPTVTR
jgi:hypothetical protein